MGKLTRFVNLLEVWRIPLYVIAVSDNIYSLKYLAKQEFQSRKCIEISSTKVCDSRLGLLSLDELLHRSLKET